MDISTIGIHPSVDIDFPPSIIADELRDVGPTVTVLDEDLGTWDDVDAVVTFEHRDAFLTADISWVHTTLAGIEQFPTGAYRDAEIALTNSSGIHGTSVAETTIGFMLSLSRRLHTFRDRQHRHEWIRPDWDEAFTLSGERVCIVGLGTLGRAIAERADALGMSVVGVRRTPDSLAAVERVYPRGALHEAIRGATFLVLAVPLTAETEGLIGEDEFELLADGAYLVNVARGPVVDDDALLAALRDGTIRGAALDVFDSEPLPADSPFWEFDEVLVSPHSAVADRDFYRDIADLVRTNVERITAGAPVRNRVV